jgi:hypothetical protein
MCREPELGGHAWLEYPGGSVGFYPGTGPNPLYPGGIGEIHSPDDHAGDANPRDYLPVTELQMRKQPKTNPEQTLQVIA